jgi:hypothetical protein
MMCVVRRDGTVVTGTGVDSNGVVMVMTVIVMTMALMRIPASSIFSPRSLNYGGSILLDLPNPCRRNDFQQLSGWKLFSELLFHFVLHFSKSFTVINVTQNMFYQSMEYIQTMDLVPLGNGQIKSYNSHNVGLGHLKRRVQTAQEL